MDYIDFTTELLHKFGINSHLIEEGNTKSIDGGIRGMIFDNGDYEAFLNHSLLEIADNKIYRYTDEYRCCYIVMKIPDSRKFYFIGPYLLEIPDSDFMRSKIPSQKPPEELVKAVEKYYMSLALAENEDLLIAAALVLGKCLWGDESNFSFEYLDNIFFDQIDPSKFPENHSDVFSSAFNLNLLEEKYNNEKLIMDAISSGNINNIDYISPFLLNNISYPHSHDSLRSRKNQLISFNTLLRKAAEQGNVHPLHIENVYFQFVEKAEKIHSVQEGLKLQGEMIKSYCFLVKKHSLAKYSTLISKVITIIDYDITADLSLKAIAEQLFVNPGYLSTAFKRESGQTLTEYVHSQRTERAASLLRCTNMQIQDISASVGIMDINYFIRLFKKKYGITPTAYRREFGTYKSEKKSRK